MKKILNFILITLTVLCGLLLIATYFSPMIDPNKISFTPFIGLAFPYISIGAICLIIIWLIFKWQHALILIFLFVLNIENFDASFSFKERKAEDTSDMIKVMTYNVRNFQSFLENEKEDVSMLDFINGRGADIICLQEAKLQKTGPVNPSALLEEFEGMNHFQLAHQSRWTGPITFSRYPIVRMDEIRFEESSNMVMISDVITEIGRIRVFNCHLQSFNIKSDEYAVLDSISFESDKMEEALDVYDRMKLAFQKRVIQTQRLIEHIEESPYPVVVCGDFNDVPVSFTHDRMRQFLSDSFIESGTGSSQTYRGVLPSYRIDYIYHSDEMEAFNYQRHVVNYSDHYPIETNLAKIIVE